MQTARIETTILSNLLLNEEFVRKVMPFLRPEYFHDSSEKLVFTTVADAITKYNKLPTSEQIIITLNEAHNVPEPEFKSAVDLIFAIGVSILTLVLFSSAGMASAISLRSRISSIGWF